MSNPSPAPPTPAPVKAIDWAKLIALVSILLTQLGVLFVPDVPDDDKPAPVVVVDPVTPPAPAPPAPVAAPESWIVLDATNTRVVDPAIEKVAGSLKPGRWTAQGIPKPGERGVTLSIVVSDGTTPPVPEPPKPEPPKPEPPKPEPPVVTPPTVKATAATYVYEKDSGGVPSAVMAGLNKVNRDSKFTIIATALEDDPDDGTGDVPEQYKVALAAAREAGEPALVVTAGNVVVKVVKAPTTSEQITGAIK